MKKLDKCKLCRRAGEKLFLKGERCGSPSCALERRSYAPGQHGSKPSRSRRKSDYAIQLNEKQKAKAIYGVSELQLLSYYKNALRVKGATGEKLMNMLESRVDNVVYRAGWARSRQHARQLTTHGAIKINGRRTRSAGQIIKKGDTISINNTNDEIKRDLPPWIKKNNSTVEITSDPTHDRDQSIINDQLIIEFYSR